MQRGKEPIVGRFVHQSTSRKGLTRIGEQGRVHIPADVFKRLGGSFDFDKIRWAEPCPICGEQPEPREVTTRNEVSRFTLGYLPGMCACQRQEKEAERQKKFMDELIEARRYELVSRCYGTFAPVVTYAGLSKKTFETHEIKRSAPEWETWNQVNLFSRGPNGVMLLCGESLTGMTTLLACVLNALIDKNQRCKYVHATDLISRLENVSGEDREKILQQLRQADLLAIDGLDQIPVKGTGWKEPERKQIYHSIIIGRCSNNKPTMISTHMLLSKEDNLNGLSNFFTQETMEYVQMNYLLVRLIGSNWGNTQSEWKPRIVESRAIAAPKNKPNL